MGCYQINLLEVSTGSVTNVFWVLRLTKRKKRTAGSRESISTRVSIY